jgi:hypothetical protein
MNIRWDAKSILLCLLDDGYEIEIERIINLQENLKEDNANKRTLKRLNKRRMEKAKKSQEIKDTEKVSKDGSNYLEANVSGSFNQFPAAYSKNYQTRCPEDDADYFRDLDKVRGIIHKSYKPNQELT